MNSLETDQVFFYPCSLWLMSMGIFHTGQSWGFTRAPSGMVGLETSLAVTLTALYHTGKMELTEIVRRMTVNPASILGLSKGRLALGNDADVVIFDPNEEWTVDPEQFASKGRNTPFAGWKVKGRVKYTIVGGTVIYEAP